MNKFKILPLFRNELFLKLEKYKWEKRDNSYCRSFIFGDEQIDCSIDVQEVEESLTLSTDDHYAVAFIKEQLGHIIQ